MIVTYRIDIYIYICIYTHAVYICTYMLKTIFPKPLLQGVVLGRWYIKGGCKLNNEIKEPAR